MLKAFASYPNQKLLPITISFAFGCSDCLWKVCPIEKDRFKFKGVTSFWIESYVVLTAVFGQFRPIRNTHSLKYISGYQTAWLPFCYVDSDLKIVEQTWTLYFHNPNHITNNFVEKRTGILPSEENGSVNDFEQWRRRRCCRCFDTCWVQWYQRNFR